MVSDHLPLASVLLSFSFSGFKSSFLIYYFRDLSFPSVGNSLMFDCLSVVLSGLYVIFVLSFYHSYRYTVKLLETLKYLCVCTGKINFY